MLWLEHRALHPVAAMQSCVFLCGSRHDHRTLRLMACFSTYMLLVAPVVRNPQMTFGLQDRGAYSLKSALEHGLLATGIHWLPSTGFVVCRLDAFWVPLLLLFPGFTMSAYAFSQPADQQKKQSTEKRQMREGLLWACIHGCRSLVWSLKYACSNPRTLTTL